MSTTLDDATLPNVGTGPDELSLSTLARREDVGAIVLLLQRDYYCPKCRQQVQDVATRYDEFTAAGAEVVSVVPDVAEKVQTWQDSYDLPYPLLADDGTTLGDAYDQPTRFGALGKLHDMVGRMPEAVVLDTRDGTLKTAFVYEGTSPSDRPSIDQLLAEVEARH